MPLEKNEKPLSGSRRSVDVLERTGLLANSNRSGDCRCLVQKGQISRNFVSHGRIRVHPLSLVFQRAWRIAGNESWKFFTSLVAFVFTIRAFASRRASFILVFI